MLEKVAFVVILVSAITVAGGFISDRAIGSLYDKFDASHKQTAKQQVYACCPQIVLKPPGSLINPLSVYRAYFSLIIDYGNCTYDIAEDSIFQCCADWGDGSELNCTTMYKLGNCEMAHQYPKTDEAYRISATYCNAPYPTDQYCCSTLTKNIYVTN